MTVDTHEVDPGFKAARLKSQARKRRILIRRLIFAGIACVVVVGGGFGALVMNGVIWIGKPPTAGDDQTPQIAGVGPTSGPVFVPAIVDLAGDPMRISLGDSFGAAQVLRVVNRPDTLPPDRAAASPTVQVLADTMVSTSQRFMTTLPSGPQDFALYQAQRGQPPRAPASSPADTSPAATSPAPASTAPGAASPAAPASTEPIADTTTTLSVRPSGSRYKPDDDYVARVLVQTSIEDQLRSQNFVPEDVQAFAQAAATASFQKTDLASGDVIAVRGRRDGPGNAPLRIEQMSFRRPNTNPQPGGASLEYVGSLARKDDGTIVEGSDPWLNNPELFNRQDTTQVAAPDRQYRLLDAIYSTGVRNDVPTGVLGTAIKLLSRSYDLNAFASADDKLLLAYAKADEQGSSDDQILYVGVKGTDRSFDCYVYKGGDGTYSCFKSDSKGGGISTAVNMVTPVHGVLVSQFGPSMDPVLKKVVNHKGVDWTAPLGTPVVAAFAGTVKSAGDAGDDGNKVVLSHSDGRQSSYSHLDRFVNGLTPGAQVAAGDVIGYVGNTGKSDAPHLTFGLEVNGKAVDPLEAAVASDANVDAVADTVEDDDSSGAPTVVTADAVNAIINIESAGKADAKNPLSSAVGLGQFIQSTWLRMIQTYRPDLWGTMSQQDILALRLDPTISREMIKHLAQEGEAYLRARGQQVTPGRLYLCHFLGMAAAAQVGGQDPATPLNTVLPQGVFTANPFLAGYTVADIENWAENKMKGKRYKPVLVANVQVASPDFLIFKAAVDGILSPPSAVPAPAPVPAQGAPAPTTVG